MNSLKSILLVEDDEDDQIFFVSALSELKNATLFDLANNGKAALERLSNTVVMPDRSTRHRYMLMKQAILLLPLIGENKVHPFRSINSYIMMARNGNTNRLAKEKPRSLCQDKEQKKFLSPGHR